MPCECCGTDKPTSQRSITDIEHGKVKQPNLCDDCERKIHNPALRDAQFNEWIKRLFAS